jgi:hypothetical protein
MGSSHPESNRIQPEIGWIDHSTGPICLTLPDWRNYNSNRYYPVKQSLNGDCCDKRSHVLRENRRR